MRKPTHTLGSDWSFDKMTQEVTDEHRDMVAIIQWLSSPEIGGMFAAAPDMLEALECAEDANRCSSSSALQYDLINKWTDRFESVFPGCCPSNASDLNLLAKVLRRCVIAKAKGEAE